MSAHVLERSSTLVLWDFRLTLLVAIFNMVWKFCWFYGTWIPAPIISQYPELTYGKYKWAYRSVLDAFECTLDKSPIIFIILKCKTKFLQSLSESRLSCTFWIVNPGLAAFSLFEASKNVHALSLLQLYCEEVCGDHRKGIIVSKTLEWLYDNTPSWEGMPFPLYDWKNNMWETSLNREFASLRSM